MFRSDSEEKVAALLQLVPTWRIVGCRVAYPQALSRCSTIISVHVDSLAIEVPSTAGLAETPAPAERNLTIPEAEPLPTSYSRDGNPSGMP